MKVAVIHNHPIHYKHLLFTEMKRQGLDFDVLFQGRSSSIRQEPIPLSDDLYRSHIAWPGPYEDSPAWRRIVFSWRKLNQLAPDVVIIGSYYAVECWSAWVWALAKRKPMIMWYESNEFDYIRHWPKEFLKRLFCSHLCRAHVYGLSNKEYLMKLGVPTHKIDIKRAVVNVSQFTAPASRTYKSQSDPRTLLCVGRLAPEKNVGSLLDSFAAATRLQTGPPMELLIAGSGPCELDLKAQAKALGITERVKFLGYVQQSDLPKLYQSVDFFVLPSVREPWGLVSLEAMLARLPILISNQCGCARDVVTPANGWTFSPHRIDELTALIAALPNLPLDRVKAMGEASFTIAQDYSAANCARVILASIAAVCGKESERREREQGYTAPPVASGSSTR